MIGPIEKGTLYQSPYVKTVKLRAYKLTPLVEKGIIDLDGEVGCFLVIYSF